MAGALKRNIVLSLAQAELFRPRWSERIMDETEGAIAKIIVKQGLDDASRKAKLQRQAMEVAFEDAKIFDYESHEASVIGLPDQDDAHVIAVAIKTKASIIVTDNLKDFPAKFLEPFEIEAKSADDFIADAIDLNLPLSLASIKSMRARFQRPEFTVEKLLIRMEEVGFPQTADILHEHKESW